MSWNLTPRRAALGALTTVALAAVAALPVQAKDLVAPRTVDGTTYINGGIGQNETTYMRRIAKEWPLRMTFSQRKDDEFIANVNLKVTDHTGATVLALPGAGPMTYARLQPGKYRVTASFDGKTEVREVALDGKAGTDLYFHWKSMPAEAKPAAGND